MDIHEKINEYCETFMLGSCQYETIGGTIKYALTNKLTPQQLADELGYKLTKVINITPKKWLNEFYLKYIRRDDNFWPRSVFDFMDDIIKNNRNPIVDYNKIVTHPAEFMLDMCRNAAWDLWSAAPTIADFCLDHDLEKLNPIKSPGYGPALNIMFQSSNYETGLYCYMLLYSGAVTDMKHFNHFDT